MLQGVLNLTRLPMEQAAEPRSGWGPYWVSRTPVSHGAGYKTRELALAHRTELASWLTEEQAITN